MKCEHCGMELDTGSEKCSACGALVNKESTSTPSTISVQNMGIENMNKPKGFGITALVMDIVCWLIMVFAIVALILPKFVEGTPDVLGFIIQALVFIIYSAPVNIILMILALIFSIVQRKKSNRAFSKVVLILSILTFLAGIAYTGIVVFGYFLS